MNAKHQFKYTYNETGLEEFSPVEVTFDMPGEVTISQMLYNFESYLKACGFYFDGHLEIVDETLKDFDLIDELDGTLYEFEDEPKGGCMADFDNECGCDCTSSSLEADKKVKGWNEEREIREKASKRADELKQMEERWKKVSNEKKASILADVLKASGCYTVTDEQYEKESRKALEKELKKNKWVHGICNPPSPDWKKNK